MSTVMQVLSRSLVLGAVWAAWFLVVDVTADSGVLDALSAGLMGFALLVGVASVWAFVDGMRRGPSVLLVWTVAIPVFVVADAALRLLLRPVAGRDIGAAVTPADFVGMVVFLSLLVGVPALVLGAVGTAAGQRSA